MDSKFKFAKTAYKLIYIYILYLIVKTKSFYNIGLIQMVNLFEFNIITLWDF